MTMRRNSLKAGRDDRYAGLVGDMAQGKTSVESSQRSRQSYFQVGQLKEKLALELREYLGDEALADGLTLVLCLIGTSLSLKTLRADGWKAAVQGILLWGFISATSLLFIFRFS